MDVADYRKMLNEARTNAKPLGCGVGLSKDGKTALFLIHKTHAGLEVSKALKAEHPDIVNLRFGAASVEKDEPTTVLLKLNRPVTGIAKKLTKTLKGSGFKKVKLLLEDGTPLEEDSAEEDEVAPGSAAAAAQPQETPAAAQPAAEAPPPPPPPPLPPAAQAAPDAGALKQKLADLIKKIPGATAGDAARNAALLGIAKEANTNLGTGNLAYAATAISQLETQLAAPAAAAAAAGTDFAALQKELMALGGPLKTAIAADPTRQAALVGVMTAAKNLIEAKDEKAASAVAALRQTLGVAAPDGTADTKAPATPPDPDKLSAFLHRLILLIPSAAGEDDALRAEWMSWAEQAGKQLSASDVAGAAATIEKLRAAMAPKLASMSGAKAKDPKDFIALGKSWLDKRTSIGEDVEKLRQAIAAAMAENPAAGEINSRFATVTAPIRATLDTGFAVALNNASKEADAKNREKHLEEARDALGRYNAFLQQPLLADLDDNPFTPLQLKAELSKTLAVFAQALR